MTTINVTTQANTVAVTAAGQSTVVQVPSTTTVTATTIGPQGPTGGTFSQYTLDESSVVDGSLIYYDVSSGEYKANATWTTSTVTDGGNF